MENIKKMILKHYSNEHFGKEETTMEQLEALVDLYFWMGTISEEFTRTVFSYFCITMKNLISRDFNTILMAGIMAKYKKEGKHDSEFKFNIATSEVFTSMCAFLHMSLRKYPELRELLIDVLSGILYDDGYPIQSESLVKSS